MTGTSKGFTLIELLIVIAIIAIIAAIAIPSLLKSRIAANEASAAASLKNLVSINSTWRQSDVDGNGILSEDERKLATFNRIDANSDGYIDAAELAAARKGRGPSRTG